MSLLPSELPESTPLPPAEGTPTIPEAVSSAAGTPDLAPPPMPDAESPAAAPPAQTLDGITGEELEAMLKQADDTVSEQAMLAAAGVHLARITNIVGEDVFVDLDDQSKGTIPLIEFAKDGPPAVGQELRVVFEQYNPAGGIMVCSKKKADRALTWARLRTGEIIDGRVTAMNKGGLEVDIGGVHAFMPASQCDVHRMKDISTLLNLVIRCEILEINRAAREVIVSRRNALIREREETRKRILDEIQEGQIRNGVVGNLTEYGAFVNLGGVDGLLHISDMSWGHVRQASDVLKPGQEIQVKILKVDRARGKVSVGLKQTRSNPWETVETKYPPGTRVQGRVTRLTEFGAFVEIEEGLEALVPLSEMSWVKRVFRASDVVQENAVIEAVVLSVDKPKRRISLGIKQLTSDPWLTMAEQYPKNATVTGKVARLTEFGAFIELQPGIDGLVHISEMSEKRIKAPGDVVEIGKEVQVRVLGVDVEKHRISLSLRPPPPEPTPAERQAEAEKAAKAARKKERKKPLRGGLSSHWDWTGGLNLRL